MGHRGSRRRRAWFWVGVVLLSISVLWWILLIVSGGDTGDAVITGVITTFIPVGIGIYCVRRGRKTEAAEVQRGPEPTYASQPAQASSQGTLWAPELGYPSERTAKPAQRSSIGPKTWKPTTAGILNIIAGVIPGVLCVLAFIAIFVSYTDFIGNIDIMRFLSLLEHPFSWMILFLITSYIIAGGLFALGREHWGWALAGSIIAIFALFPLGVASTIFVLLSKDEFE